ncbi:WYL domain containing protein [uncultured Caudovirales phage]|jgi:hypothetical protein|uniref:WYL domain containing protein n=1 Tax=uncultured Caudovirales phage TaxID=2100421 RepID=A0A6J5PY18_9CAUD|nr:WYL domain containing protein [uncultured Caudovirales phage]
MTLTPVLPETLRSRLREGVVQFAFKKVDGTLRTAVGTTNLATIPTESHPKGTGNPSDKSVRFFDIEKREWRSVSILREIYL